MLENSAPKHPHPGPAARFFPVLTDTNREKRMASFFLAMLQLLPELA